MQNDPVITLTTDFGLDDPFVGVMKGVILGITRGAKIIDLTHGIPSHHIWQAAFTIGMNYTFFPERTVHVVIADPGVGSLRRPIIVATEQYYFIGPDNGVFSYIYKQENRSLQVIHITEDHYFLKPKSLTFHGRDAFAPVAAWLAGGTNVHNFGGVITDYCTIDLPCVTTSNEEIRGEIIHIDKFGNALSNIRMEEIDTLLGRNPGAGLKIMLSGSAVPMKKYYGEAEGSELYCLISSSEYVEFFVNRQSAASIFNIRVGDTVTILSSF